MLLKVLGGDEELSVAASVLFDVLDVQGGELLAQSSYGLVSSKNPESGSCDLSGVLDEFFSSFGRDHFYKIDSLAPYIKK